MVGIQWQAQPNRENEEVAVAKNGFKVLDSDMHIVEPWDMWIRYIDPEFKSIAPVGRVSDNVRDLRVDFPGTQPGARRTTGTPHWTVFLQILHPCPLHYDLSLVSLVLGSH